MAKDNSVALVLKITFSALIGVAIVILNVIGPAIAGSSHNISMNDRGVAMYLANNSLILGPIIVLCIWLPWTKIFRSKNKADTTK